MQTHILPLSNLQAALQELACEQGYAIDSRLYALALGLTLSGSCASLAGNATDGVSLGIGMPEQRGQASESKERAVKSEGSGQGNIGTGSLGDQKRGLKPLRPRMSAQSARARPTSQLESPPGTVRAAAFKSDVAPSSGTEPRQATGGVFVPQPQGETHFTARGWMALCLGGDWRSFAVVAGLGIGAGLAGFVLGGIARPR
jgi:hypothetical protein